MRSVLVAGHPQPSFIGESEGLLGSTHDAGTLGRVRGMKGYVSKHEDQFLYLKPKSLCAVDSSSVNAHGGTSMRGLLDMATPMPHMGYITLSSTILDEVHAL